MNLTHRTTIDFAILNHDEDLYRTCLELRIQHDTPAPIVMDLHTPAQSTPSVPALSEPAAAQ